MALNIHVCREWISAFDWYQCISSGPSQTSLLFNIWKFGLSRWLCSKNWAEEHLEKFIKECWGNPQEWKFSITTFERSACHSRREKLLLLKFWVVRKLCFALDHWSLHFFYNFSFYSFLGIHVFFVYVFLNSSRQRGKLGGLQIFKLHEFLSNLYSITWEASNQKCWCSMGDVNRNLSPTLHLGFCSISLNVSRSEWHALLINNGNN